MGTVIYIMGVSGCGKTTVGRLLAGKMRVPFFDADDFHSIANKEKMRAGIALTDRDREDWLSDINTRAREEAQESGVIFACSALKEHYRSKLSEGIQGSVKWVFLEGDYNTIFERLQKRKGHYMPAELLQSQFDTLEKPVDAIVEDIRHSPEEISDHLYTRLSNDGE